MPIRFRCPHCTRLLGIARRKGGTLTDCPQCGKPITVPAGVPAADRDNPGSFPSPLAAANESAAGPGRAVPAASPRPRSPLSAPRSASAPPTAAHRPVGTWRADDERPLFEQNDVDALLGLPKPGPRPRPNDSPSRRDSPGGLDLERLGDAPEGATLAAEKITVLVVGLAVLLGIAFAAGYVVASIM